MRLPVDLRIKGNSYTTIYLLRIAMLSTEALMIELLKNLWPDLISLPVKQLSHIQ